ncbi:MAG: hypothetical protein R3321_05695 [Nitrososphaeraceae archaeon]|nr:hypothetical protein [Nitrososphaeraceae archaeon]
MNATDIIIICAIIGFLAFLIIYFVTIINTKSIEIEQIKNMNCEDLWNRIQNQSQANYPTIGDVTLSQWITKECFR